MNPNVEVTRRIGPLVDAYERAGSRIAMLLLALAENYSARKAEAARRSIEREVITLQLQAARFCKREIAGVFQLARRQAEAHIDKNYTMRTVDWDAVAYRQAEHALRFFVEAGDSIRRQAGGIIGAIGVAANELQRIDFKVLAKVSEFQPIGEFAFPVEEIVAETIREKQSLQYAMNMLRDKLRTRTKDASFVEVNGRYYGMRAYCELVARTELINAYTQGTLETMGEYGEDLVKYLQHDAPCEICAQFQGEVFSTSGSDPDYAPLTAENTPPLHPNCECGLQPISKTALRLGLA